MYRAFEASGPQQVRLARQALEISPDCADAYVLLAEHAETADEAQKLYEQGVAAGERAAGQGGVCGARGPFLGCSGNPAVHACPARPGPMPLGSRPPRRSGSSIIRRCSG